MIDVLYISETSNQHDLRFETRWKELGKSVVRLDSSKFKETEIPYEISKLLSLYSPRLVQVGPLPNLSNFVLDVWSGPTLAVSWGFDLLDARLDEDSRYKRLIMRSLRDSSALLVDSRASVRVAEKLGAKPDKVYFLPWGVEDVFLHRGRGSSPNEAKSGGEITFISTRNHEAIYNVSTVVESFLSAGVSGSNLIIAGTGSETEILKSIASANSNPGVSVEFLGRLGTYEMMEALSRSNFYISAASVDGSSVSLLEAMAMGVVPIVPDLPGNREWVDASIGYTFDLNSEGMTELIQVLASNKSIHSHHSMSHKASDVIHKDADWTKNSALLATVFEKLVNGDST